MSVRKDRSPARYGFDVVTQLVGSDFRLRYRQPLLGWFWALAQPLTRFLVLTFLFTRVLPLDIPNYPAFLFAGILAWQWFASSTSSATGAPLDHRHLLFRPGMPRFVVPLVSVFTDLVDFLVGLPILLVFVLFSGGIPGTIVYLPIVLAVQGVLIVGLGYITASVNVYLRDTKLFVDTIVGLLFYLTPVFYKPTSIPARFRPILELNPMAHIIRAHRAVLIEGRPPTSAGFILTAVFAAVVFNVGTVVYARMSPGFVDEL